MTPVLLAGEASSAVSSATGLLTTVTSELSLANAVAIIGASLGASVVLFLLWWGSRYLIRKVKGAFSKGKLSV